MEKKTIFKLAVAGVIAILVIVFGSGLIGGKPLTYQMPTPYTARSVNDFSTVDVAMTVQSGRITDCTIASSGESDLLNDELRAQWADSIVASQTAENDVISGATLVYSAASVREAANDIMVQAGLREPAPEPTAEPEPADGDEAEAATGFADGVYAVDKTTDFSDIHVEMTVDGGKIVDASIESNGANDLLTDEHRSAWAAQIVEKQDIDAVSGVTVSSDAVSEAVGELLAQARGEAPADDGRVAELEAALAEAETRAADAEAKAAEAETKVADAEAKATEAEAKVADAEVKIAEVEAKVAETEAKIAALEAAANTQAETAEAQADTLSPEALRLMRPRPIIPAEATPEAKTSDTEASDAEASGGDALRLMRTRPTIQTETAPKAEAEVPEAETEAPGGDTLRLMRTKPTIQAETAPEAETSGAEAEALSPEALRLMRPRPAA